MSEFFSMGGYALYVWPCYILSFFVLIPLGYRHARQLKRLRKEVDKMRDETETAID